jgi:glycosyltransferase involved in cell wall biosynthesis
MSKKNVVFVGSFKNRGKDGSVGGQMYACETIMNSEVSQELNWTLIDSTADSNKKNLLPKRVYKATSRLIVFVFTLIRQKNHAALIFTADGFSFWEKGLMALLAKSFTKAIVIIAPRSGIIIEDISKKGLLSRFIPFVFNKVDFVICQSKYWKMYFEKIVGRSNLQNFVVIENCIDFSKYKDITNEIDANNTVEILFLAWVDVNKGIFELIEACRLLNEEKINFNLTIAGNGISFEEVRSKIADYNLIDNIKLFGWALGQDKIMLLQKSNIFVLPSYYEGYPNSLLEAMASSKACIATNVGSIADIIVDGENGFIINSKNHIQLYEKLKELILDRKKIESFSVKARETVLNNNTSEIFYRKIKNILKL